MSDATQRDRLVTIVIRFLLIGSLFGLFFILSFNSWETVLTVSSYVMISFLAIACAAAVLGVARNTWATKYMVLFSAMILVSGIHIIGSIRYLFFEPMISLEGLSTRIVADTIEFAIFGIVLLVALYYKKMDIDSKFGLKQIIIFSFVIIWSYAIIFHVVLFYVASHLMLFNFILSTIAFLSILGSIYLVVSSSDMFQEFDSDWLVVGLLFFLLLSLIAYIAPFVPQMFWRLNNYLLAGGFIALLFSFLSPVLRRMGVSSSRSIQFPIAYCMLALIPFIITSLIAAWLTTLFYNNVELYLISKASSAFLSTLMAYSVWINSKRKPEWYHFPIILLYTSWSIVEIISYVSWVLPFPIPWEGSPILYVLNSIITLFGLLLGIRWVQNPPNRSFPNLTRWLIPRLLAITALFISALHIEPIFIAMSGVFDYNLLLQALLLATNLPAMFLFLVLSLLILSEMETWRTLRLFIVGILSLWLAANILRGYSVSWSAGWWAAELIVIVGLLFGPVFLVQLYYDAMIRSESLQKRVTLYSDLLVHDISNIHQAVLVALELLELHRSSPEDHDRILLDATSGLNRADHLVRNVRSLGVIGELGKQNLSPRDIVQTIASARDMVSFEFPNVDFELRIDSEEDECFIDANDLLVEVFTNLIRNSIKYSPYEKRIEIHVTSELRDERLWWRVQHVDFGRGISPQQRERLFERYMSDAEGIGLGLSVVYALTKLFNGEISVEGRDLTDHTKGTIFTLIFPAITS